MYTAPSQLVAYAQHCARDTQKPHKSLDAHQWLERSVGCKSPHVVIQHIIFPRVSRSTPAKARLHAELAEKRINGESRAIAAHLPQLTVCAG